MLTGADLLAKVKSLGEVSKSDLVRSCGYISEKKDGTERLNFTAFYEALLAAKGMDLTGAGRMGKAGRKLSYRASVQFNGNLMVGKAYTSLMGVEPGDEFEIKINGSNISLKPVSDEEATSKEVDTEACSVEKEEETASIGSPPSDEDITGQTPEIYAGYGAPATPAAVTF